MIQRIRRGVKSPKYTVYLLIQCIWGGGGGGVIPLILCIEDGAISLLIQYEGVERGAILHLIQSIGRGGGAISPFDNVQGGSILPLV